MKTYEVAVIGAGFFGLRVALFFAKKGKDVIIIEAETSALSRASIINQARIHNGYHYPRSYTTALSSHNHYKRFCDEYSYAVYDNFKNIYALAKINSYTTSKQFEAFCDRVNIPLEDTPNNIHNLFSANLIEKSYFVEEAVFDGNKLKDSLLSEISKFKNVKILFNCKVNKIDVNDGLVEIYSDDFKHKSIKVFNTTYAGINSLLVSSGFEKLDFRLELTELAFVKLPKEIQNLGITIMDGQFFSLIYYPSLNCHSLTHVRYTPHIQWHEKDYCINPYKVSDVKYKSKYIHMLNDAKRYLPILNKAKYLKSMYTIKAVPVRNEINDGRPIVFKEHYKDNRGALFVSILGSKIDTIYDLENYLVKY